MAAAVGAVVTLELCCKLYLVWHRCQRRRASPSAAACGGTAGAQAAASLSSKKAAPPVIDISASASASAAPPASPAAAGGQHVSILSSLQLTPDMLVEMEEQLVGSRNRFVCLQLVTMAREQHAAAVAAAAAGDGAVLAAAARVHVALLRAGGTLVAGALFYPRRLAEAAAGPAGSGAAAVARCARNEEHVYIELLVCSRPRAGHGSALLRAVESFARAAMREATHVRLLSVESAQGFYLAAGYGAPDGHHESCKPL
eukprot:scaffold1.g5709.t1